MLTNNANLPSPIVKAVERHTHVGADYSASMLEKSVRQVLLDKRHSHEIVEDVSDRIWAIMGEAVHYIASQNETSDTLQEEYLTAKFTVGGKEITFSGRFDLYESLIKKLWDIKTVSVWSVVFQDESSSKRSWEVQLNAYAYMLSEAGFPVTDISVLAIMRDWSSKKAKFSKLDDGYPKTQAVEIKLNLWGKATTRDYIKSRIELFESHKGTPDDKLPECTPIELWQKPTIYSVQKKGVARSVKLHKTLEDASAHATSLGTNHSVEVRPGVNERCNYCSASPFCNQYKAMPQASQGGEDE